jgi:hypothetical protein
MCGVHTHTHTHTHTRARTHTTQHKHTHTHTRARARTHTHTHIFFCFHASAGPATPSRAKRPKVFSTDTPDSPPPEPDSSVDDPFHPTQRDEASQPSSASPTGDDIYVADGRARRMSLSKQQDVDKAHEPLTSGDASDSEAASKRTPAATRRRLRRQELQAEKRSGGSDLVSPTNSDASRSNDTSGSNERGSDSVRSRSGLKPVSENQDDAALASLASGGPSASSDRPSNDRPSNAPSGPTASQSRRLSQPATQREETELRHSLPVQRDQNDLRHSLGPTLANSPPRLTSRRSREPKGAREGGGGCARGWSRGRVGECVSV